MLTRTDHGELGELPIPLKGYLSDSHMRAVSFDGQTAGEVLCRAGLYLADHGLDEYVAAVTYHHRDPGDPNPVVVTVFLEAVA